MPETDVIEQPVTETPEPSFDMEAASDRIGAELFPQETAAQTEVEEVHAVTEEDAPVEVPVVETPVVREAPKSWAKEVHEVWAKIDPKAQEYIEKREKDFLAGLDQYKQAAQYGNALSEVLKPYTPILQQKGLDAPKAITDLMNAYVALTQGPIEQRKAALSQVAQRFGLAEASADPNAPAIDPRFTQVLSEVEAMKAERAQEKQYIQQQAYSKAEQDVTAFASDPKHIYFDEVLPEVEILLRSGKSLQDAYDQAVWANPVTRQKELSRIQTESEQKLKERARLDALPKKAAAGLNVRGKETQRAPTETLGSMDDVMRETFREIKART